MGALGQQGRLLPRRAIIIVEPESYYADNPELELEAELESDDEDIPLLELESDDDDFPKLMDRCRKRYHG